MMDPLRLQLARARRGAWLIGLVTAFAVVATWFASSASGVTYTGRASLTLGSQYRAPEQDAVLAGGYADLFNSPGYQQQLRDRGISKPGVAASARTAAASPIIYIEVTSADRAAAQDVASRAADALYQDVNTNLGNDRQAKIDGIGAEIEKQRRLRDDAPRDSPQALAAQQAMTSLQNNANELRGDTTNELQMLQRDGGVSAVRPSVVVNLALAAVGGLVLGLLAALALAALRNRVVGGVDVEGRFGVPVLAELRRGRSARARGERAVRIERLANALGPQAHPRPLAVAVTSAHHTPAVAAIAGIIAQRRAQQGERAMILCADLRSPIPRPGQLGIGDVLAGPVSPPLAKAVEWLTIDRLRIVGSGTIPADPFAVFTAARTRSLVGQATEQSDVVVLTAPPLIDASEAQTICAAARTVIVVVEVGHTRLADLREAIGLVARSGAVLLGAVVVHKGAASTPEVVGAPFETAPHDEVADAPTIAVPVVPAVPSRAVAPVGAGSDTPTAAQQVVPAAAPTIAQPVVPVDGAANGATNGTAKVQAKDTVHASSSGPVNGQRNGHQNGAVNGSGRDAPTGTENGAAAGSAATTANGSSAEQPAGEGLAGATSATVSLSSVRPSVPQPRARGWRAYRLGRR